MTIAQTMRTCATSCVRIICVGVLFLAFAASALAQNLYVAAEGFTPPDLPIEIPPSGTVYQVTPGAGNTIFASGLGDVVRGLTFNPSGDMFVVSGGPVGSVIEINQGGAKNTYATGVTSPFDLAFNNSGELFVTEGDPASPANEVAEIAPGGGAPTTFITGFNEPRGLAFNSAGDLFVANLGSSNIVEITPGGTKFVFATGLSGPFGLAFNKAGDLFVADTSSGDITEITPDGAQSTYATGLTRPRFLAFDSAGDLFVSNLGTHDGYLSEITPNGTQTDFDEGFLDLSGVAFSPVPEPSMAGLMAIGIVGVLIRYRRVLPGMCYVKNGRTSSPHT